MADCRSSIRDASALRPFDGTGGTAQGSWCHYPGFVLVFLSAGGVGNPTLIVFSCRLELLLGTVEFLTSIPRNTASVRC